MCAVLPPGAAQASRTRCPSQASSNGAAHWAPASWIDTRPAANPGSLAAGTGRSQQQGAVVQHPDRNAFPGQQVEIGVARDAARIHAETHGRVVETRRQDRLGALPDTGASSFSIHQAGWDHRPSGVAAARWSRTVTLPQEPAQQGIDEPARAGGAEHSGRPDGMVDDRVGPGPGLPQLVQGDEQQAPRPGARESAAGP